MGDSGGGGRNGRNGFGNGTYSGDPADKGFVGPPDRGGFGNRGLGPSLGGNGGIGGGGIGAEGGLQTHGEQVAAGETSPFGTDPGEVASARAARAAERAAQRAAFVGPPERGFFGGLAEDFGEFLGFTGETTVATPAQPEQDRPTEERALQRAVFAEVERAPRTVAELRSRVARLGTGFVTGEEAETLGGLARPAAEARAAGLDVDVARQRVAAPAATGFLGTPDISRAIGTLLGEEYDAPLGTFAGFTQTQRQALQAGLARGTVRADPTAPLGIAASPIGVAGELTGAGYAARSFGQAAVAAQRAAQVGLTAAAGPLAGVALAGAGLIGAIRGLATVSEEFGTLGISPTTPARAIGARPDAGGYEQRIAERDAAVQPTQPTQPVQPPRQVPVAAPPSRRRPARGAGLLSTIRTGFFGVEAPTIRYAR